MLEGGNRDEVEREGPKYCPEHLPSEPEDFPRKPEHLPRKPEQKERQAKLIERALEAAAESLPILEAQVRSLAESSPCSVDEQTFDVPRLAQRPSAWHTSRAVNYPRTGFNVDWHRVSALRVSPSDDYIGVAGGTARCSDFQGLSPGSPTSPTPPAPRL
jgi:hypothetical protein